MSARFEAHMTVQRKYRHHAFDCLRLAAEQPKHRDYWLSERARFFDLARFNVQQARQEAAYQASRESRRMVAMNAAILSEMHHVTC